MAEREGFEPSVRHSPYTRFPGVHLKPLGHLSGLLDNDERRRISESPLKVKISIKLGCLF